jgi:uncharacterized membrane protein
MSQEFDRTTDRLARTLGWTSLGLGAAKLAAPGRVSRLVGIDDSDRARGAVPLVGVRELVHAVSLLGSSRPAFWVWARVAGDAADLTLLGRAAAARSGQRRRRAVAAASAVAAVAVADVYTALRAGLYRAKGEEQAMHLHASVTVNRPRQEVYRCWRDFENLPRFMEHLESVRTDGDGQSHWKATAPVKKSVEWDAEIVELRPDELISWRSTEGAEVPNSGSVNFTDAAGERGTEVRVDMRYAAPGGRIGAAVAGMLGEHPEQQVRDDLRRLKQYLETGEVVRSEGSPEGHRALRQAKQRPAQPVR